MGQEIGQDSFSDADFETFAERLRIETDLVESWEREGRLAGAPVTAGFEVEAWLVGDDMRPAARNADFLARAANPLIVPELSAFNIEFNGDPAELTGTGISDIHKALLSLWQGAGLTARDMGLKIAMIGILPTVRDDDLCPENMSASLRYKALNEQVFRMRKGKPIRLSIDGRDQLESVHHDVMLEAATTSFQIHVKVPKGMGATYYNASKLASAPLVAVAANSPYLFGKDLWDETRIPLFEQAVSVGDWDYAERVTFGVRYIEKYLSEVFLANRQRYPVLLPELGGRGPEKLDHLRLQNGTIWRWNRPLVGWDADGTPHFRIEQRVVPAGPTILDSMANAAFYYGLVRAFADDAVPPHKRAQFGTTRDNFYTAARHGLRASIRWDHKDGRPIDRVILDEFLPLAERGLRAFGVDDADIARYLGVIDARVRCGQNGAAWQRAYVAKHTADMPALLAAYLERQETETPVHEWPV